MNLLIRTSDETSDYIYRYFKQMIDDSVKVSAPLSEYALAYCEAYEQEKKRIESPDYPRLID